MTRLCLHQLAEANTARRLGRANAKIAHQAKERSNLSGAKAREARAGARARCQVLMIGQATKEGLGTLGLEKLSLSGRPGLQPMSLGCRQQLSPSGHQPQQCRLHGLEPQRRRSGPEPPARSGLWQEALPRLPWPDLAPRDCTRNLYPQPVSQPQFQPRTGFKLWRKALLSKLFLTAVARPGHPKGFSNWRASSSRRI